MNVLLFEDHLVDQLRPITDCRPAYAISCGGYRLRDVVMRHCSRPQALVRPFLDSIQSQDFASVDSAAAAKDTGPWWLVNARLVPRADLFAQLEALPGDGDCCVYAGDSLAAARLTGPTDLPTAFDPASISSWAQSLKLLELPLPATLGLFEYPHDVVRHHLSIFSDNLNAIIAQSALREVAENVFAEREFQPPSSWSCDTTGGPIVLQPGCRIGPFTVFHGPVLVGHEAKVNEHASLKDGVSVGHHTKIGGEVEATIIEPYTNKQHYGFLGHSYVGSWVNLGAGTCNSDLKNTYGHVRVEYDGQKVDTQMQFFGCVVGDCAKTAINSSIFTGKLIGSCSMVYGHVAKNVPAFTNCAFGELTEVGPEVVVKMQKRMFQRRGQPHLPQHEQLIRDLYAATAHERNSLEQRPPSL